MAKIDLLASLHRGLTQRDEEIIAKNADNTFDGRLTRLYALYAMFLHTQNPEQFLEGMDTWYQSLLCFGHKDRIMWSSLRALTGYCKLHDLIRWPEYLDPERYAEYLWLHEEAHKGVFEQYGIQAIIETSECIDGPHLSYVRASLPDVRRAINGDPKKLAFIWGSMLDGPGKIGLGYPEEQTAADRFLTFANQ
ncbi:MAG: hypothetical protein A2804_01525 [Candidatus Pacebacteria bacterium RIFCSPHIGHO2_01_FULL_46_10]|nr:MAG: hypothetical protein A2804_01525 [Candidatus Pacebacteria bacterium RIFCSPHIGHO2_01_FULL_46_10]